MSVAALLVVVVFIVAAAASAPKFFLVLFVYCNTCVGVVLKLLSALLSQNVWVCVCVCQSSELRELNFLFILLWYLYFTPGELHSETIALFCNCLSPSLLALLSFAPIASKMRENCQLEFMTCLLSEMEEVTQHFDSRILKVVRILYL